VGHLFECLSGDTPEEPATLQHLADKCLTIHASGNRQYPPHGQNTLASRTRSILDRGGTACRRSYRQTRLDQSWWRSRP